MSNSSLGDRLESLSNAAAAQHAVAAEDDLAGLTARVRRDRAVWRSGMGAVGAVAVAALVWGGASAAGALGGIAANSVSPSEEPGLVVGDPGDLTSVFEHLEHEAEQQASQHEEQKPEAHEDPAPQETTSGGGHSGDSSSTSGGGSGDLTEDPEYQEGYDYGVSTGYDQGYTDGHNGDPKDPTVPDCDSSPAYRAGYEEGWVDGYDDGYAVGAQEYADYQYDQGFSQGKHDGWDAGYYDGYDGEPFDDTPDSVGGHASYQQGYADGWTDQYDDGYASGEGDAGA